VPLIGLSCFRCTFPNYTEPIRGSGCPLYVNSAGNPDEYTPTVFDAVWMYYIACTKEWI